MANAEKNAAELNAIQSAGIQYAVRKYAGMWVPVVIKNGKRQTFAHCTTSYDAMSTAIRQAAKMSRT